MCVCKLILLKKKKRCYTKFSYTNQRKDLYALLNKNGFAIPIKKKEWVNLYCLTKVALFVPRKSTFLKNSFFFFLLLFNFSLSLTHTHIYIYTQKYCSLLVFLTIRVLYAHHIIMINLAFTRLI